MSLSDIRKNLAKINIDTKMNEPTEWISTGSAVLNHRLTGRLDVGLCNRRTALLWGESGSGKTFVASNLCKNAQDKGYTIIYLDSEESISEEYMTKIGIDLSPERFIPVLVDTIEDVTASLSSIFSTVKEDEKFILIIDSLAGLLSEKEMNEFEKGESKGDQGQFAKKLKLLVKNINRKIAKFDAFCVMVTHAYQNQDMYSSEGKWICTGGKGFQFFPSFSVMLTKAPLKGDEAGLRMGAKVTKTRFTAPFQTCELKVPYTKGIDFTDGLIDVLEEEGVVTRNGAWYSFDYNGEITKFQASKMSDHLDKLLEIYNQDKILEETVSELEEDVV